MKTRTAVGFILEVEMTGLEVGESHTSFSPVPSLPRLTKPRDLLATDQRAP